ncbi:ABC transporter ATP-binding protein [Dermatophilus congolensis]|uniref:ABC transporter ATP-binding protein n=1 Tax=Dermatophilus congolensis TaxID=1863 RepID=UPI001AB00334|nr:ABC transporter ATP-binding protein [Dermatophilus congolensis]MBO3142009.1 ABC transporter ATP-binding protein [Dermatophilus congolensis]MBO3150999.1 ABC transporter ATP-binding protein [Dermatophilus congolensis]MBO3161995.1 ABC transporter ATP-binding protein [Dermatophilus congolensis]MBO3162284.1 ABC transporter ATP-binding protein [Dermatophilus congolensis]MBO3175838.1 ABC transporter ATP-binding protein [Dermatophilus congolensis]
MDLTFHDLRVDLGGHTIVNNATFTVPTGTTVALLGANGSGKSTLLRTAYRVHHPTSGHVTVNGDNIHTLTSIEAARRIAVMTQETGTDFPLTGIEVVLLGRVPHQRGFGADSPQDLDIAHTALRDVGAPHLANRTFAALSGGEKQRILLARALTQQTPVLLLDEPTNHADLGFQHDLLHIVTSRGATVLAALHDVNLALAYTQRAVVIHNGTVLAEGPTETTLTTELIDQVLGIESVALTDPRGGTVLSFRRRVTQPSPHNTDRKNT